MSVGCKSKLKIFFSQMKLYGLGFMSDNIFNITESRYQTPSGAEGVSEIDGIRSFDVFLEILIGGIDGDGLECLHRCDALFCPDDGPAR